MVGRDGVDTTSIERGCAAGLDPRPSFNPNESGYSQGGLQPTIRLQLHLELAARQAADRGDRVDVDDRAAMDLPEELRVELVEELLDRLAD
jgi:hypothetical protein